MRQQSPNQIDPNLFSLYTNDDSNEPYHDNTHYQPQYSFPSHEQAQPYHHQSHAAAYQLQSLEQIASEVLDMDGDDAPDRTETALVNAMQAFNNSGLPVTNGNGHPPKPDESVDSAVALPRMDPEFVEQNGVTNGAVKENGIEAKHDLPTSSEFPTTEPSAQTNGIRPTSQPDARPQSSASKSGFDSLPLYQPPAPVSVSPEVSKRQPALTNGNIPHAESNGQKRKRDSLSAMPSSKRAKIDMVGGAEQAVVEDDELQSLELARMLAQEDRGLRRRS